MHTESRGVLSMYSQMIMAFAICLVYLSYFTAGKDAPWRVLICYKLNIIFLCLASFCYLADGFLYCYDPHAFCNIQLIPKQTGKTCEERNKWFMLKIVWFYIFWVPIWFGCANAMRRYARNLELS